MTTPAKLASNVATAFVELATPGAIETQLYWGASGNDKATLAPDGITYFKRTIQKCTWFALGAVVQQSQTTGQFGGSSTWIMSRSGDIALDCWLDVVLPAITPAADYGVAWVANVGHNLIEKAQMKVQQIEAHTLTSYDLDCYKQYCVPSSKQVGYDNMIGNVKTLYNIATDAGGSAAATLPETQLSIPLPFWFTHDSGNALPMCAIPYNEIQIQVTFRALDKLLYVFHENALGAPLPGTDATASGTGIIPVKAVATTHYTPASPQLVNQQLCSHYAVLTSTERQAMSCTDGGRSIVFKEYQQVNTEDGISLSTGAGASSTTKSTTLQLSHPVTEIYYSMRNTLNTVSGSNYTTAMAQRNISGGAGVPVAPASDVIVDDQVNNETAQPYDSGVHSVSMSYDNMKKFDAAPAHYTALVQPFYFADNIPTATGYNLLSSCLHSGITQHDPSGSVNHAKINTTTLEFKTSDIAKRAAAATTTSPAAGSESHNTLVDGAGNLVVAASNDVSSHKVDVVITAANWNVVQVQGGAIGYPYY